MRPLEVKVDPSELRKLMADLKALEGGKPQAAAFRKALRATATPIAADVKAGYGWSSRIPGAVGVSVSFSKKKTGVAIKVNSRKAPHARPFENGGSGGTFRHRVFGRDVWVSQQARPSIFPRTARRMGEVEQAVAEAMVEAARSAGFR